MNKVCEEAKEIVRRVKVSEKCDCADPYLPLRTPGRTEGRPHPLVQKCGSTEAGISPAWWSCRAVSSQVGWWEINWEEADEQNSLRTTVTKRQGRAGKASGNLTFYVNLEQELSGMFLIPWRKEVHLKSTIPRSVPFSQGPVFRQATDHIYHFQICFAKISLLTSFHQLHGN